MDERDRFVRGTLLGTLGCVAAALAAFGLFRKWDWAVGFAVGALVSFMSFRLIVASVARFTERRVCRVPGRRHWWASSLIRLLGSVVLLGAAIRYLPVNLIGLALGLAAVQLGIGGYLVMHSSAPESGDVGAEDRKP